MANYFARNLIHQYTSGAKVTQKKLFNLIMSEFLFLVKKTRNSNFFNLPLKALSYKQKKEIANYNSVFIITQL